MRYSVAIAIVASLSSAGKGASIQHEPLSDGFELIALDGDIVAGDEQKFAALAVQYKKAVVVLKSDGGQLVPALEIGKAIHLREFATVVADDETCASACALIWVAGTKRFLAPRGQVGFHASYLEANGKRVESGVANALVGRYLTQLELPERSIIYATAAGPDSIRWLRASDGANSGITFEVLTDDKSSVAPPPIASVAPARAEPVNSTGAGGWRVASATDTGSVVFVNTDEIKRDGDIVQFWKDSWWDKPAGGANRSLALIQANCSNKSYRQIKIDYFLDEHFISDANGGEIDYAIPDSVIFNVIRRVCEGTYLTPAIDDRTAAVARFRSSH